MVDEICRHCGRKIPRKKACISVNGIFCLTCLKDCPHGGPKEHRKMLGETTQIGLRKWGIHD